MTLTSDQNLALRMMAERDVAAMVTKFGWTWPETIRNSEAVAGEVIRIFLAKDAEDAKPAPMFHEYSCGCKVETTEAPRYYDHACAACHVWNWTRKAVR